MSSRVPQKVAINYLKINMAILVLKIISLKLVFGGGLRVG